MHYCYILYSERLDKYYIGSSRDVKGRLNRHNSSNKGYTSTGKPWTLIYSEEFNSKEEALRRECQLKRWKSRRAIEELIKMK